MQKAGLASRSKFSVDFTAPAIRALHPSDAFRFSSQHRLSEAEVKKLFANGRRLVNGAFEVKLVASELNESEQPALGKLAISIPKRLVKLATLRNQLKRLVREAFRQSPIARAPVQMLVMFRGRQYSGGLLQRVEVRESLQSLFSTMLRRIGPTKTRDSAGQLCQ